MGKLASRARRFLLTLRSGQYLFRNPARDFISLHCPEYILPPRGEDELIARILRAYRLMKHHQPTKPSLYSPSPMWQRFLNKAYLHLMDGLERNDKDRFHFFLANFGTWKEYTAVESSRLIHDAMKSSLKKKHLENDLFYKQLEFWQWFYNNQKDISALSYPRYGNQAGAYIDGVFVGAGSFFNEIYGSLLKNLINEIGHPVIAEIGAGYGKLAFFLLRNCDRFTFIDFDLPETLCLASYYLMKVFPNKHALLYGEDQYSLDSHAKYDLIFMPPWEIEKVGSSSVDLFINKNSLGEMEKSAVENYIKWIAQATRYFFHMNHDVIPANVSDQATGLRGYEYPVPENFKLLFRYPDLGHFLFHEGRPDYRMDIFVYLYERDSHHIRPDAKA